MRLPRPTIILFMFGLSSCVRTPSPAVSFVPPRASMDQHGNLVVDGETWLAKPRMEFVPIPAGQFMMGSPEAERDAVWDEVPAHRVEISRRSYLGKYEVTQAAYECVMGSTPSVSVNPADPVDEVRWRQAMAFCSKLSSRAKAEIRLPTEAEWEYACRAGTQTRFSLGNDPTYSRIDRYAWHRDNAGARTHPVGRRVPNPWGLYDMHGNVWEWCLDGKRKYTEAEQVDPRGPDDGHPVLRGGGWFFPARYARSAARSLNDPAFTWDRSGFRVIVTDPPVE